jgi:hypothetical protein
MGLHKTYDRLRSRFYWQGMYTDPQAWVDACPDCEARRLPSGLKTGQLQSMLVKKPFEQVGMDVVGPLPLTRGEGYKYVVITDYCTRWAEVSTYHRTAIGRRVHLALLVWCSSQAPERSRERVRPWAHQGSCVDSARSGSYGPLPAALRLTASWSAPTKRLVHCCVCMHIASQTPGTSTCQ